MFVCFTVIVQMIQNKKKISPLDNCGCHNFGGGGVILGNLSSLATSHGSFLSAVSQMNFPQLKVQIFQPMSESPTTNEIDISIIASHLALDRQNQLMYVA